MTERIVYVRGRIIVVDRENSVFTSSVYKSVKHKHTMRGDYRENTVCDRENSVCDMEIGEQCNREISKLKRFP